MFVLGAGSSVNFGIGAGSALAQSVANIVDFSGASERRVPGDVNLLRALANGDYDRRRTYETAGALITSGLPGYRSVDDFLYTHGDNPDLVRLGKAAITMSILTSERGSTLYADYYDMEAMRRVAGRVSGGWLSTLLGHLLAGVRRSELPAIFENLSFVNFNYDRCVEHFFHVTLSHRFQMGSAEAAELLQHLKIEHPYGQIGRLPWQQSDGPEVRFGANLDPNFAIRISETIKTFTEQTHSPEELASWRSLLQDAQQIIYLGFGFHRQNMKLLEMKRSTPSPPQVYLTAYETPEPAKQEFMSRITDSILGTTMMRNLYEVSASDCDVFMRDYGLRIAG